MFFVSVICCLKVIFRCIVLRNMVVFSSLGYKYCEKTCVVSSLSFSIVIKYLVDGLFYIFIF